MSPSGDRLRRMARIAGDAGGRAAAAAMAREGKRQIQLQLRKRSHAPGTPTPAAPGQPPARISGALHDHITTFLPRSAGAYRWVAMAGSDGQLPYDRIQNQGGVAGRGHRTVIPPRPYLHPAKIAGEQAVHEAGAAAFRAVVHGG